MPTISKMIHSRRKKFEDEYRIIAYCTAKSGTDYVENIVYNVNVQILMKSYSLILRSNLTIHATHSRCDLKLEGVPEFFKGFKSTHNRHQTIPSKIPQCGSHS